jgi:hypothetical protein
MEGGSRLEEEEKGKWEKGRRGIGGCGPTANGLCINRKKQKFPLPFDPLVHMLGGLSCLYNFTRGLSRGIEQKRRRPQGRQDYLFVLTKP